MRVRFPTILPGLFAGSLLLGFLAAKCWASSLPATMTVTVTPSATGPQLIRTSVPLPRGFLHEGQSLSIRSEKPGWWGGGLHPVLAGVRPLSWYPVANGEPKSVRRALVTFPASFRTIEAEKLLLLPVASEENRKRSLPVTLEIKGETVVLKWKSGQRVNLNLLAPARTSTESPRLEVVEANEFFLWHRWHFPDRQWPRIFELRCDALGGVVVVAHLQRNLPEDGFAPDFGWEAKTPAAFITRQSSNLPVVLRGQAFRHNFAGGDEAGFMVGKNDLRFYHPAAPLKRRGHIAIAFPQPDQLDYRYLRCTAAERVPMQPASWQRAEIVIAPARLPPLSVTLESAHQVVVAPERWQELYGVTAEAAGWTTEHTGSQALLPLPRGGGEGWGEGDEAGKSVRKAPETPLTLSLSPSEGERGTAAPGLSRDLNALIGYHRDAIVRSLAVGDDWGNVTGYSAGAQHGGVFGMNRLNHCAAIFEEGWRSGDRRLLETAVLWCDNFFDQTIWWGEKERGGTRYNNIVAMNKTPLTKDYMWRSDSSVNFCTKGYDAFWLAWEQTGDPRMKEALDAQIARAAQHLHVDQGECRNIGDARDFIRLYRYTGEQRYLDEALRLFRELRHKLSTGELFDQGGKPLDPDPPFIDEDQRGLTVGYAKPYIIGYALAGLPELLAYAPNEPKLREVVRAVANFLSESQDPVGGWRYPHPASSAVIVSQGLEHAWQITQAARALGPDAQWLGAIEATLRQRLHGWRRTGQIFSGLEGWEISTGKVKERKELYDLYKKPADRDAKRDHAEGRASFSGAPPEGIVYFTEVLEYYLQHRPASRLLAEPKPDSPLGQVLSRVPATK